MHITRSSYSFQFHEGPIKTAIKGNNDALTTLFQFHEGPIKTISPTEK